MSDEFSAPPAPDPASTPATPQPRGIRPPTRKSAAPPPPAAPSKTKAYLVIGIIVSCVLLTAAIGWRLYVKLTAPKPPPPRNVKVEWQNAWNEARQASKEMFGIESKVWVEGRALTPEELAKFKAGLKTLQKTDETYHQLIELLRGQKKLDSQEAQDMGDTQVPLKAWIWDANAVLDPAAKPPSYGGIYIPMYSAEKKMKSATDRLHEIRKQTQETLARNNPEEILKLIKEIRGLRDALAACRDEFLRIDEEIVKGLAIPGLNEQSLEDLKDLRDYTAKAIMAFKEAGQIRSDFPSEEALNEPPKEATPKEEPKKEEPPKAEEPPKQEPPK